MTDWKQFWYAYNKKTGKLTWRIARPADAFAIERIRLRTEALLGHSQRKPNLFAFPVMLALVAEDEHGEVVDVLYVETQVEVIKIGCSRVALNESSELDEDLGSWLRDLKFNTATATCLPRLKDKMAALFIKMGFWPSRDGLIRWQRWL